MTPQEEFVFLGQRYLEQAKEDVKRWESFLEKQFKGKKESGAQLPCSDGLNDLRRSMEGCFATCIGNGGKGYVKVEFKKLIQAQDFYTELLKIEKGI